MIGINIDTTEMSRLFIIYIIRVFCRCIASVCCHRGSLMGRISGIIMHAQMIDDQCETTIYAGPALWYGGVCSSTIIATLKSIRGRPYMTSRSRGGGGVKRSVTVCDRGGGQRGVTSHN